ncbi:hypothetical protein SJ05684_b55710 (plasmid) [Sinorhizobium sojae CCBAU 05684]|uniref:Uncharacterized protein n=2 Tax=Sinorhizobium sojae TaxID=716925 RepID=A0A249PKU8_9HYPH|nr:hypothetical protein SJ05684_b55710 [Sinorhizobium sojae CCBAU 05684]
MLHLNFDVLDTNLGPNVPKDRFRAFLKALPTATFSAYRFDAAGDLTLVDPADLVLTTKGAPSGNRVDEIIDWLDRRVAALGVHGGNWTGEDPIVGGVYTAKELDASKVLSTAGLWDAPLPQEAGLVRFVELKAINAGFDFNGLLVLPFFNAASAPPTIPKSTVQQPDGQELDITYDAGLPSGSTIACRTQATSEPKYDPSSLVDEKTGFLMINEEAPIIHRTLEQVRNKSGSLFWSFPQIQGFEWLDPKNGTARASSVKRLIWRTMNGLATMLDPLLLSLEMPFRNMGGPFVSALIGEVLERVPEADPRTISDSVRNRVKALIATPPAEADSAEREKVAELFRALFEIGEDPNTTALLSALMNLYVTPGPADANEDDLENELRKRFDENDDQPAALDRQLVSELGDLAAKLQSEIGMEDLLLGIFQKADINASTLFADSSVGTPADWESAYDAFNDFLKTSLNGLDAARHGQATLYEMALVSEAKSKAQARGASSQWSHNLLIETIQEADWFARRLTGDKGGAFEPIASACPVYALQALDAAEIDALRLEMKRAYDDVLAAVLPVGKPARFNPDHVPRPLPIQISVDADTTDLDSFAERYNGVSVLIKRNDSNWAYANLAKHQVVGSSQDIDELTLYPLQSVDVDGQRQLFLEFNGLPFSSNAMVEFSPTQDEALPASDPFYTVDAPTKDQLGTYAKLPSLAYGMTYRVATHIISSSGALPTVLQKVPDEPWWPSETIDLDSLPVGYIQDQPYLRSTSIGRTVLNEKTEGRAPRIGVSIDGVHPLFGDFPRIGLAAAEGMAASLDVLRNADGTGAFTLPSEGQRAVIELTNLMWWGGAGTLKLALFLRPNPKPGDRAESTWTFPISNAFEDERAIITIVGGTAQWLVSAVGPKGTIVVGPHPIPAPSGLDDSSCWLRLSIETSNTGDRVALSLRDLSNSSRANHMGSRTPPGNLVLVAPDDASGRTEWLPIYQKVVSAEIVFPKVAYEDFDRWYNNPAARSAPTTADREKFEKARQALLAGVLGRTLDDRLSKLIDALPDPAIDKMLIELVPLDGLTNKPAEMVLNYAASSLLIELVSIHERPLPDIEDAANLVRALANLARHHSADVTISSGGTELQVKRVAPPRAAPPGRINPEWTIEVNVPRGLVAQLTVRPLLSAEKVSAFTPRILELATEKRTIGGNDYYVMDGASLVIESMLGVLAAPNPTNDEPWLSRLKKPTTPFEEPINDWADLIADAITIVDAGKERRYDLALRPDKILKNANGWRWRQLGSVDIQTQRWRHTGRPIYSWFDPKANKTGNPVSTPVIALKSDHAGLGPFIGEAFFDRDDEDADTQTTRLKLNDLHEDWQQYAFPAETRLQAFPWERPSATLFRHRLVVRSRYAGALRDGAVSDVPAWRTPPDDRTFEAWTHVAMLADQTRLQLTRPRLRALIPLTQSPEVGCSSGVTTPPIMAVLDEAPYVHGGLADRIGAEIKTGFGYELRSGRVGLKDSRKEVGPDPRLTYSPMELETALAMSLSNEGPVGLTFDTISARAPAFANTALVLCPVHLGKPSAAPIDLEEHFLSVALRRYLDHRWVVEHDQVPTELSSADAWWIEFDEEQTLSCSGDDVCKILIQDDLFDVRFNSELLYKGGNNSRDFVSVCKAFMGALEGLAFQYLPLEAGRASISVFGRPNQNGYFGNTLPVLLATVEWALPKGAETLEFRPPGRIEAHRTSASPTTLMNWTRTSRNFELLSAFDEGNDAALSRYPVSAIAVKNTGGTYQFTMKADAKTVALEPSLTTAPNPLYVHRHLAVVRALNVRSAGRDVEVYDDARRLLGSEFKIAEGKGSVRVVEFETPAVPLCWNLPNGVTGLDQFKVAHFDLFSVLGTKFADNKEKAPIGLSVFLRPLVGTRGTKRIASISFALSTKPIQSGGSVQDAGEFTVSLPADKAAPVRAIVLNLIASEANYPGEKVNAKVMYGGGGIEDARVSFTTAKPVDFSVLASASMDLTIASIAGLSADSEFWADISMLTLPPTSASSAEPPDVTSFTFDWFFTGGDAEASDAVSVRSLGGMVEAQARIVSVSPPIPVDT